MFTKFFFVKCFTNFYKRVLLVKCFINFYKGVLLSTEDVFNFDQHFTKKKKNKQCKMFKIFFKKYFTTKQTERSNRFINLVMLKIIYIILQNKFFILSK